MANIALKESITGQHILKNLKIGTDKIHDLMRRTEKEIEKFNEEFYIDNTSINNAVTDTISTIDKKKTNIILNLYDHLSTIDLTDEIKYYIANYHHEHKYVPIRLSY